MDVRLRVLTCMVLEQMDKHPDHANQLGLENVSVFCVNKFTERTYVNEKELQERGKTYGQL